MNQTVFMMHSKSKAAVRVEIISLQEMKALQSKFASQEEQFAALRLKTESQTKVSMLLPNQKKSLVDHIFHAECQ